MSRSPYIDHVVLTNKHSGKRTHKVQAFVIHHMAAKWTGKRCAEYFRDAPSRQASANYCIGYNGDVALNVEEGNRAWTSSSNWADQRALTYELANSKTGHPWEVSDKTINKLIVMLAEQHKRYGLKKASYTGDTNGTLWRHDWFASTNCPGPYLGGKLSYIAEEVNKILRGEDKPIKPASPKPTPAPKPQPSKTVTGKQILHLPASAKTWRVYKPNGPYTVGNEVHLLTPSAYGGLDYEIKGNPAKDVYLIDTGVKGRVAIYAGAETGAKITNNKAPVAKPASIKPESTKEVYNVTVDGYLGPETIKALQRYFGLVVDGEIWGQYHGNQATKAFNQRAVKYGRGGSPVVKALQRKIGASPVDGIWGADTTRALQRYLGTPVDGEIWRPSSAIKELQRRLNAATF